ncbi:hypothetical protein C3H01_002233, partial [Neisseria gonorrhoeae]
MPCAAALSDNAFNVAFCLFFGHPPCFGGFRALPVFDFFGAWSVRLCFSAAVISGFGMEAHSLP